MLEPAPEDDLMLIWLSAALASDVNFSPDRPGIGESTGTPGKGHVMVEGGLALTPDPLVFGTSSLTGRFGIDDGLELRLRAPDVVLGDGVSLGSVGVGAKVAGTTGRWAASVVPELAMDLASGDVGGSVGSNLSVAFDVVGLWGRGSVAVFENADPLVVMGGGASVAFGGGGIFVNAGHGFGDGSFVGGGGWWALGPALQIDASCDALLGDPVVPLFGLGASAGF